MNTLGIVLVMGLLGLMVVSGSIMSAFCIRRLRRILATPGSRTQVLPVSMHCFPLAMGILFVVYGIAGINKLIGFGEMMFGTTNTLIGIAAQSIPVVIVFLGAYLFIFSQHKG